MANVSNLKGDREISIRSVYTRSGRETHSLSICYTVVFNIVTGIKKEREREREGEREWTERERERKRERERTYENL